MALFSITCTTCQSRLTVRDRAVIGQILACPKCQSMVLVEPPAGWDAGQTPVEATSPGQSPSQTSSRTPSQSKKSAVPPQPQQKSETATPAPQSPSPPPLATRRSSLADTIPAPISPEERITPSETAPPPLPSETVAAGYDADELFDEPPLPSSPAKQPPPDVGATVDVPIETHLADARSEDSEDSEEFDEAPDAPPKTSAPPLPPQRRLADNVAHEDKVAADPYDESADEPTAEPVLPGDSWVSPGAQRWQQTAMIVGGVVIGLVMALGVFAYAISNSSNRSSTGPDVASLDTTAPTDPATTNDSQQTDTAPKVPTPPADGASGDLTTADGGRSVGPPTAPIESGDGTTTSDASKPPLTPIDGVDGGDDPASPAGPKVVNPFDLDAPVRDPAASEPGAGDPARSDAPETPASVGDAFGDFADFLDDRPITALPELGVSPKDVDAADKVDVELVPERAEPESPLAPRPEPREVNVTAQLALPIVELNFDGVPLVSYLRFLSQLSAIPVTIEPAALLKANISPSVPVTVNLQNTTVRDALAAGLQRYGLSVAEAESELRIVMPAFPGVERGEIPYTVDDLLSGEFPIERFVQLTAALIEPESWQAVGGENSVTAEEGKVVLVAPPAVHFDFLVLCEKLRVARGGAKRSSFPADLFTLATRREKAAANLAKPLTINFVRPTPLREIVARIENETGVRILIDWAAVADQGWNPDGVATLTASGQPLADALTALLAPLDLTWSAVSADLLQITTPAALAAEPEIEFHPVASLLAGKAPDALLDRIRTALGPENFRDQGGPWVLEFDPQSQCLLALLAQPKHAELTTLLTKWRPAAP